MKTMALVVLLAFPAYAGDVLDGDTIRREGAVYRLYGIDAPEKGQLCGEWACGVAATERLRAMAEGAEIACKAVDQDRYGRTVAICYSGGVDLNREMVRSGHAWAYRQYSDLYADSELEAEIAGRGIWGHPSTPAWEWRKALKR